MERFELTFGRGIVFDGKVEDPSEKNQMRRLKVLIRCQRDVVKLKLPLKGLRSLDFFIFFSTREVVSSYFAKLTSCTFLVFVDIEFGAKLDHVLFWDSIACYEIICSPKLLSSGVLNFKSVT